MILGKAFEDKVRSQDISTEHLKIKVSKYLLVSPC